MTEHKRILFILHLPPPVHGAAMVGQTIRESGLVADAFETRFVNLSASETLAEVRRVSWKKVTFLFRLLRQVRKELRSFRPDGVYVTPTVSGPGLVKDVLVAALVRRHGISPVLHLHNKGVAARRKNPLYNFLYHSLFKDARVILQSGFLYPDIAGYVPPSAAPECPNGIDAPALPLREGHTVPEMLFLSNLLPDKGVVDLLDACRLLKDKGLKFTCRFVGAPTKAIDAVRLEQLAAERGVSGMVRYDGPLYGPDKQAAWARADLFVLPTRDDCFPLVILEAMAAGLPVVSTREGGIPSEVIDGSNGFLCEKGDAAALADRIGRLLDDPALRREMGWKGRARYEQSFTREAFEANLVRILKENV